MMGRRVVSGVYPLDAPSLPGEAAHQTWGEAEALSVFGLGA